MCIDFRVLFCLFVFIGISECNSPRTFKLVKMWACELFFDSCIRHCQSLDDSLTVDGQSARETFANWYLEGSGKTRLRVMDCA